MCHENIPCPYSYAYIFIYSRSPLSFFNRYIPRFLNLIFLLSNFIARNCALLTLAKRKRKLSDKMRTAIGWHFPTEPGGLGVWWEI